MADKRKVPALRFRGFEGEWTRKRLGEVGSTYSGLSGKAKKDFGHGNGRYITYLNVFTNPITSPSEVEAVELDSSQNQVLFGDALFTTSSETPEEVGMSSVVMHRTSDTYLNSFCFGYRSGGFFDHGFLAAMLRSAPFRKEIVFLAQGISRYNISKRKVMEINVPIPQNREQSRIGTFFQNLDALIAQRKSKADKLLAVKKSMLHKMFPQGEAEVPEIRFRGFVGEWKQRKFGDFVTEIKRPIQVLDNQTYELVTVKRRNEGVVPRGSMQGKDILVKNYSEVRTGDYLISKRQVVHGATGVIPPNLDRAIVSNEYLIAVSNGLISTEFLALMSKLPAMYKLFFISSFGVDIEKMVFDVEDWKKRSIAIPEIGEQKKITSYFTHLDALIILQQRELDKLKNLKKAFLDRMFV